LEEILKKLIDIDKNARSQVKNANEASAKAVEEFDLKKQNLKEENKLKFTAMLEAERKKQKASLESIEKEIEQSRLRIINELNALYEKNGEQWVDMLVKNVISD